MYAFATVPDHDLKVVVGLDRDEALRSATDWEMNALLFTGGITLLDLRAGAAAAARAGLPPATTTRPSRANRRFSRQR